MSETLVLSPSYEAVDRISWQRAVSLFFQGKVEIVEEYADKDIRSVTFAIKMPSVVRFLTKLRGRHRAVKFSRENVFARDGGMCAYQAAKDCPRKLTRAEATYDHVVPRAHGGQTTWDNVVICCVPCNQQKGGRTPDQAKMRLRVQPVRPKKLPDVRVTVTWHPGMPDSWRTWVRDFQYWNGELQAD